MRDSAGVRIVENARPAWRDSERLVLAATPRLAIGNDADSAYTFRQVRGVMRLQDGRIAVADGRSLQLRLYSAQGRFLAASAGRGVGPGQILNMHWARRLRGDTIAIGAGLSTVALFSSAGEFARVATLPPAALPPAALPPATLPPRSGAAPEQRYLLVTLLNSRMGVAALLRGIVSRSPGSRWTDSLPLRLVTDSSDVPRELGTFPSVEVQQVGSGPAPVWLSSVGVFVGNEERFYAGFGDRYEIRVYATDGTLQSLIRRSWTPTPITEEDWEQWVVEWSKLWVRTTGAERERDVQNVRESPWAEENPAFSEFMLDPGGRLWVREAHWQDAIGAGSLTDIPAVPSAWSVFDTQGRWLGDVTMPASLRPFEIGTDYVAGILRTNDSNQVVVYDLRARGRQ